MRGTFRTGALLIALAVFSLGAPSARSAPGVSFVGGVLPHPTERPSAEPGIAVDGGGTIWVSSFMGGRPPTGPDDSVNIAGTGVWRSTNSGASYTWIVDPWKVVEEVPGLPFAGNDSDIAAATEKNQFGFYNVYAVALYPGNASLAWSPDGGATWVPIALTGITGFPFDRPWAAADGACTLYLAYHSGPSWFIQRYDFCDPTLLAVSKDPVTTIEIGPDGPEGSSILMGKLQVDTSKTSRYRHRVYLPMETCTGPITLGENEEDPIREFGPRAAAEDDSGCEGGPKIALGVSSDYGATWKAYTVAPMNNGTSPIWPATVASDADGTVYVSWFNERESYISRSENGGRTWTTPVLINTGDAKTAVYPTVAATGSNTVAVAYYGTTRDGNANDLNLMGPPGKTTSAPWHLWWARSTNGGRTFSHHVASPVIHYGELCTQGGGCATQGSRNLFDDFGMSFSPKTGRAVIAYTTDQVAVNGFDKGTLDTTYTAYATQK